MVSPLEHEPRGFRRASVWPKGLEEDLKNWPCLLREECWHVGWWRGIGASLGHEQPRPLPWALYFRGLCCDFSVYTLPHRAKGPQGTTAMPPGGPCPHLRPGISLQEPGLSSLSLFPRLPGQPPEGRPHSQFATQVPRAVLKEAV